MAMYNEDKAARLEYEAYSKSVGGKNHQGDNMPTWRQLPDKQKKAWLAATEAGRQYFNDFLIESAAADK